MKTNRSVIACKAKIRGRNGLRKGRKDWSLYIMSEGGMDREYNLFREKNIL